MWRAPPGASRENLEGGLGQPAAGRPRICMENGHRIFFEKERCAKKIFRHRLEKILDMVSNSENLYVSGETFPPPFPARHTIGIADARILCGFRPTVGWSERRRRERNGPPGPAGNLYGNPTSDLFRKRNIGWKIILDMVWKKFWNISGNKNNPECQHPMLNIPIVQTRGKHYRNCLLWYLGLCSIVCIISNVCIISKKKPLLRGNTHSVFCALILPNPSCPWQPSSPPSASLPRLQNLPPLRPLPPSYLP